MSNAPPPKAQWRASPDVPLRDLLLQMAGLHVDFIEIPMGQMFVTVIIGPEDKQPGLRDVVAEYKARK